MKKLTEDAPLCCGFCKGRKLELPDGRKVNANTATVLEMGLDHYWHFHDNAEEWKEWCPVCRIQVKQRTQHEHA